MFASFDRFLDGPVDLDSYYELNNNQNSIDRQPINMFT